jgi:hypothetical protein
MTKWVLPATAIGLTLTGCPTLEQPINLQLASVQLPGTSTDPLSNPQGCTPFVTGKRAKLQVVADLENQAYAPGQSLRAMRSLLTSPHSICSSGSFFVEWYFDPQVEIRLIGFLYQDEKWTGQILRANAPGYD